MSDRTRTFSMRKIVNHLPTLVLAIGAVLMVLPFVFMISTSLRPISDSVTVPPQWFPKTVDWTNYANLASQQYPVFEFLQNSLLVSVLSTLGIVVCSCLAGYAFAKFDFRLREPLFALLLASLMVPIQVMIVPLYWIMQQLNLMNSLWSLIVPALVGAFAPGIQGAFGIFMMRQFFRGTPNALLEASAIDGAGPIRSFYTIALPLAKPAIASLALIVFIMSWNDYFSPLVFLNSVDSMTLPVGIQALRPPFGQGSTLVMAAVSMAIIPVLILFVFGQRWIVEGFVRSGLNE